MEALRVSIEDVAWIAVEDESACGCVRRSASTLARRLAFSEHRTGEIAIAATELATNLFKHAIEGTILLRIRRNESVAAIELIAIDAGPGVADISALARDGCSTVGTLGIGLGAAIRLATTFDAYSEVGRGTVMVATFAPTSTGIAIENRDVAMLTRAMDGTSICGDACAERRTDESTTLLLTDGLGHGELAAHASREAVRAFYETTDANESPASIVRRIDAAIRSTRGTAIAVVRIDATSRTLLFAGVGNVAAWIDDGERRRALPSIPGIVGHNARTIRETHFDIAPGSLLIMHSDGLTSKWDLRNYPGLRDRDVHLIAATLMRDAGIRHDDASVLVTRTLA